MDPKQRELVSLSLDLQIESLKPKTNDEKKGVLEARILGQVN
ncbi:MAG: hypothetical protein WBG04_18540 [Haloferula sp.]